MFVILCDILRYTFRWDIKIFLRSKKKIHFAINIILGVVFPQKVVFPQRIYIARSSTAFNLNQISYIYTSMPTNNKRSFSFVLQKKKKYFLCFGTIWKPNTRIVVTKMYIGNVIPRYLLKMI